MLAFFTVTSFAQDEGKTNMEEKVQYEEAVSKLSKNMTVDEVVQNIGEPTRTESFSYLFDDGEYLMLFFNDGKLSAALNKNNSDFLAEEYTAKTVGFSVLIDNEELIICNPILTINDKNYFPIEELSEEIRIELHWNQEKQQLEITTQTTKDIDIDNQLEKKEGITKVKEAASKLNKGMTWKEIIEQIGEPTSDIGSGRSIPKYSFAGGESLILGIDRNDKLSSANNKNDFNLLSSEYKAIVEDFPVFINGEQVLTFNNIVTIDKLTYLPIQNLKKTYISIEDFTEQLGITVNFNEEKQQLEITTK